jgi:Protein of unknown function (DUF3040)
MPLPEDEERQLQQIEQALNRDDPKFGRRMRASGLRVHYKRKLMQALAWIMIGVGLPGPGIALDLACGARKLWSGGPSRRGARDVRHLDLTLRRSQCAPSMSARMTA